jgi:hypothetical protein
LRLHDQDFYFRVIREAVKTIRCRDISGTIFKSEEKMGELVINDLPPSGRMQYGGPMLDRLDDIVSQLRCAQGEFEVKYNAESAINRGVSMVRAGHVRDAIKLFEGAIDNPNCPIDAKFTAMSNYVLCCDYLGIPRRPIDGYYPPVCARPPLKKKSKITIGYMTSDAYSHVAGSILERIVKNHDRDVFDLTVFYGGDKFDSISESIIKNSDRVFYIKTMPSREVFNLIRRIDIDVLIDMDGHSNGGVRLPLFCKGAAPIQLTGIGYPGDIGIDGCLDAKLSSNPAGCIPYFRSIKCQPPSYNDVGIVTLGCLSAPAKITSEDIAFYDALLAANDNCRVVYARDKGQYDKRKADWIMEQHLPEYRSCVTVLNYNVNQYYKMFEMIDVLLDTSNWSNHILLQDALSCGVPTTLCPPNTAMPASLLSRDLLHHTGMHRYALDIHNLSDVGYIKAMSRHTYGSMRSVDTSAAWTKGLEDDIESRVSLLTLRKGRKSL